MDLNFEVVGKEDLCIVYKSLFTTLHNFQDNGAKGLISEWCILISCVALMMLVST